MLGKSVGNAPQKCRPPSQKDVGAWAGVVYHIGANDIWLSLSQEKWHKDQAIITALQKELISTAGWLNHKLLLLSKRG
jgi:hypothetical protein